MKKLRFVILLLAAASIFAVHAQAQVIVIANPGVKATEVSKTIYAMSFNRRSDSAAGRRQRGAHSAQGGDGCMRSSCRLSQERHGLPRGLAQLGLLRSGLHAQEPGDDAAVLSSLSPTTPGANRPTSARPHRTTASRCLAVK